MANKNRLRKMALAALALAMISARAVKGTEVQARIVNNGLDTALASQIESYVRETMQTEHSPGIAVGIVQDQALVYQGYFGWADIKNKKPVSESTVFRAGSISKTFTAMAMMQQWEEGKFKLDDDFNSFAPYPVFRQREPGCSPVTFESIFTHTSGGGELMSYSQIFHLYRTVLVAPGTERKPLTRVYKGGVKPGVCPGVKYAYCNFCVSALGIALEQMSGEPFESYMAEHVLGPIGMTHSSFEEKDEIMQNLAQGYSWQGIFKKYNKVGFVKSQATPMGNLFTTVPDMAGYLIALLNGGAFGGGRLVKPETLEMMFEPHYQLDPRQGGIGINFFRESSLLGAEVLGHGGAVPGFGSSMFFSPDKRFGLIVFGNVMSKPPYMIGERVMQMLAGYKKPAAFPKADRSRWPELTGYYGSEDPEFLSDFRFLMGTLGAVEVMVKKDDLVVTTLRRAKSIPLRQVSADDPYFYMRYDDKSVAPGFITFEPGPEGKVGSIVVGLRRYKRLSEAEVIKLKLRAGLLLVMPSSF